MLLEHRPRHLDIVVEGEHADHTARRVRHRRQPDGELGARLGLDRAGELGHDLVEQVDLFVRIAAGPGQKQSVMRDSISMRCALLPAASACSSSSISDDLSVMIYMSDVGDRPT